MVSCTYLLKVKVMQSNNSCPLACFALIKLDEGNNKREISLL